MRILSVSDSHGNTDFLEIALKREKNSDIIVHLGDGADDLDFLRELTGGKLIYRCRGNNDFCCPDAVRRCLFTVEGIKLFACHGHFYDVKNGLFRVKKAAIEDGADICLFGHTHKSYLNKDGNLFVLNPGSIRNGSYAVIDIADGVPEIRIKEI